MPSVVGLDSELSEVEGAKEDGPELGCEGFLPFDRFIPAVRKAIGKKRFLHSIGAMHVAVALAARHGEDLHLAALAGLLHDCGRFPKIERIKAETKRHITLAAEDRLFPKIWHALLSAHLAENEYGITEPAVLQAIRLHPTGDANMSRLDKIVFLADYIEPTRDFEGLNELRTTAHEDLDRGFRVALEDKLRHVQSLGRALHPRALRALTAVGGTLKR